MLFVGNVTKARGFRHTRTLGIELVRISQAEVCDKVVTKRPCGADSQPETSDEALHCGLFAGTAVRCKEANCDEFVTIPPLDGPFPPGMRAKASGPLWRVPRPVHEAGREILWSAGI